MIKNIGRYQVQGEIGKGGFGKVYRAWDPTVNRQVAIKILTVQGDEDVLTRFRNEAAAAGNLHHKNIVTVHDFGEHNGTPYMVMQLLEGENLQDIITRGRPLTLLDKLNIMQEVAEGLHCAHQHGIVHRDVKPANIMILPDDSVQIMDFGIARVTASASRQTRTGFVIGTVLYMSPEQFLPNMEVDYRADIWAYGVIYYELLTGKHPFSAPEQTAILYQIAHVDPPPLNSIAPDCPPALAEVVQRALMKDREFRYQSLKELQFDVQPILLDLRRERAGELMNSARELADSGQIDQANVAIQHILELDPSNRDAHSLLAAVKQQLHRRNVQPRIDGLLKRAEEFVAVRNYRQAAESIEAALRLSQTDTSLRARLDQIRSLQEQALKADRLLSEAKQQFEAQNLTGAFRSASEALEADPENSRASQLLSMIHGEQERRDNRRKLDEGLNRAKTLVLLQTYDEAINVLSDLAASNPNEPAILELLENAQREKAHQERRQRRWREISAARDALRDRQFEPVISKLEALESEFSGDPEITQLLMFAREEFATYKRAEAIDKASREVQRLIDVEHFDDALRIVEQGLSVYPGDPSLARLLQSTAVAKNAWQRRLAVEDCLRSCEQLRREGKLEDALRCVNATMLESTEEPRLAELRSLLQREYDAWRRADTLRRDLETAQRYLSEGNPDQAINLAERIRQSNPDEPKIAEILANARHTKELQEQHAYLQRQLQRISALEQAQDWKGALDVTRAALVKQPNAPALTAAAGRLEQRAADHDRSTRVGSYASSIRDAINGRSFGRAEELLRAARKEFPGEAIFQTLAEQASAAKRSADIDGAIVKIREAWRGGQLPACRAHLASAFAAHPGDQRLIALEQEIASQVYAEAMKTANEDLRKRRLDAANAAGLRALEWRPQDQTATELLNAIARERQLDAGIDRIRRAIDASEFEEARDLITAALKTYSADPRITALDEQLRSQACNAALQTARTHLERSEFEPAEAAARRALTFRDDPTARSIIAKAEAERQIATAVARVEQSRREGDASKAREQIAVALKKYPTESRLIALGEQIQTDVFSQSLNAARRDLEAGRIAEAEKAVNNALQLRPGDPSATALLASVRTERDVADVVASARQAWRIGELERCRDLLTAGLQKYPREERLRTLDSEFRVKVASDFVSAARTHLAQQRFDAAKEAASTALSYKSGDKDAASLLANIASEQTIEEAVTRTIAARRAGQFEKCIDILQAALKTYPTAERLVTLDREIREQVHSESIGLAREQLERHRFDQAIQAAETALAFRPKDSTAASLLQQIRLAKDIEASIEMVLAARRSGQLERALELAGSIARSPASESRIQQLTQEITQEIVRKHIDAGRDHLMRDRFDDAEKSARTALKYNAAEASALGLLESVRDARQELERRKAADAEAREKLRKQAEEEQERKRAEEAHARKQAAEQEARRKAEEEESKRRVQVEAKRKAEQEARRQAEEERARATAAAASSTAILKTPGTIHAEPVRPAAAPAGPEPRVESIPSTAAEFPKHAPQPSTVEAAKSRVPLMVGGAAGVIIAFAIGVVMLKPTSSPVSDQPKNGIPQPQTPSTTPSQAEPVRTEPPRIEPTQPGPEQPTTPKPTPEFQVLQSRLSFAWQRGTPMPASQSFAISGSKQPFLATASARWITVSPNKATAPRTVTVSVNPSSLQPGSHADIIRITPTDGSSSARNVAVELTVTPEAVNPVEIRPEPPKAEQPKPEPPKTEQPKPEQPKQTPVTLAPSPAAEGKWLGATRGTITYSGDLAAGGRVVINTSRVISGSGDVDFSRTPPPFDAVRVERTPPGVTAVPRGYDLVITNTTGAPVRLIQIEWSYQPKR
jgi:serine/threonine protein kinase